MLPGPEVNAPRSTLLEVLTKERVSAKPAVTEEHAIPHAKERGTKMCRLLKSGNPLPRGVAQSEERNFQRGIQSSKADDNA